MDITINYSPSDQLLLDECNNELSGYQKNLLKRLKESNIPEWELASVFLNDPGRQRRYQDIAELTSLMIPIGATYTRSEHLLTC